MRSAFAPMTGPADVPNHPFFRVLVLMGGSLAVGCGGKTVERETSSSSRRLAKCL
jgi:hypothetical protein